MNWRNLLLSQNSENHGGKVVDFYIKILKEQDAKYALAKCKGKYSTLMVKTAVNPRNNFS